MFPFVDTVDYLIDTTHAFEPCVFAKLLLPLLKGSADNPYSETVEHLIKVLSKFEHLPVDVVPDSMLREFIG